MFTTVPLKLFFFLVGSVQQQSYTLGKKEEYIPLTCFFIYGVKSNNGSKVGNGGSCIS
jgi:hypothetical protein